MENQEQTQTYLTSTFTEWMRGGCLYLNSAKAKTRTLFEQQRVHTPVFDDLHTYEQRYVIKMLTRELYQWR